MADLVEHGNDEMVVGMGMGKEGTCRVTGFANLESQWEGWS
jgi:hypothetical protein